MYVYVCVRARMCIFIFLIENTSCLVAHFLKYKLKMFSSLSYFSSENKVYFVYIYCLIFLFLIIDKTMLYLHNNCGCKTLNDIMIFRIKDFKFSYTNPQSHLIYWAVIYIWTFMVLMYRYYYIKPTLNDTNINIFKKFKFLWLL